MGPLRTSTIHRIAGICRDRHAQAPNTRPPRRYQDGLTLSKPTHPVTNATSDRYPLTAVGEPTIKIRLSRILLISPRRGRRPVRDLPGRTSHHLEFRAEPISRTVGGAHRHRRGLAHVRGSPIDGRAGWADQERHVRVEEFLELAGITLLVWALLRHISDSLRRPEGSVIAVA
jgi:hypothetical protein